MKIVFTLFLAIIFNPLCFAFDNSKIDVKFKSLPDSIPCELDTAVNLYNCSNKGEAILLRATPFGFLALGKDQNNSPIEMKVEKIEITGRVVYQEMFKNANSGSSLAAEKDFISEFLKNVLLIDNLLGIDDSLVSKGSEKTRSFAKSLLAESSRLKQKAKEILYDKKLDVVLNNGQQISCRREETRALTPQEKAAQTAFNSIQCGAFECDPVIIDGKSYHASMMYIQPGAPYSGSIHLLSGDGTNSPSVSIKRITSEQSPYPLKGNTDIFASLGMSVDVVQDRFSYVLPKSMSEESKNLNRFNTPLFEQTFSIYQSMCPNSRALENIKKEKDSLLEQVSGLELAQFIRLLANGNLVGNFVNPQLASNLGCFYQGVYLDQEAAKNLERIKKDIHPDQSPGQTITLEKANQLFKKALNMKDIAWGYKQDGCYARAHLMARRFEKEGIRVDKVWIKGKLYVPNTEPAIQWNFHVAPIVYVKDAKGEIQKMVIDPSLFNKPVTVEEWDHSMSKRTIRGSITTAYPFPQNAADTERSALAFSSSDPYTSGDDANMTEEKKMTNAKETMAEYKKLEK